MRVLIMVHRFHPDFGGVEVTAELLARGFVERHQAEVVVVTHTRETGPHKDFPFTVLREPSPLQLWKAIAGADVVFHNNPCMQFYWPQLFLRKPWLVALRTWITLPGEKFGPLNTIKYWFKYRLVERADTLVSNSQVLAGHVRGDVEVIYNSFREDIFRVTNTDPRDPSSLVYVGRLSADKGVDLLLLAMKNLKDKGLSPKLNVIGDGDYRPTIESLIRNLGLHEDVTLLRSMKGAAISEELNRHAIGVVPSRIPEPFGTVVLENAASGCVTLVADHGGLPEAIGDAGARFRPNDVGSLTDELERLMTDDEYLASIRARVPAHVQKYSVAAFVDNFYDALERTVRKARRGR
ncbi:MAG: glycosyltransferase family 4 protein [Kocuria sp.]|nr:glycosyltransferase family 4 protein [Kocuria sp.]